MNEVNGGTGLTLNVLPSGGPLVIDLLEGLILIPGGNGLDLGSSLHVPIGLPGRPIVGDIGLDHLGLFRI